MVISGIKRLVRKDPIKRALNWYVPPIVNCIYLYGKVGKGKTTTMISMGQKYKDILNYKLIYGWGGDRNEHLYVCLPSNEINYWGKIKKRFSLEGEGPVQNKVHLFYPYFEKTMPKKLPHDPPNVKSTIFTIPIKKVSLKNITHAIGNFGETDSYVWKECVENLRKNGGPAKLLNIAEKISRKNQTILRNFIRPLTKNKLLQSDNCPNNLDLFLELNDRGSITVFCFEFLPEEYRIFVFEWILSQMATILDKSKGRFKTDNLIMINEAAEFFRATDDSISPERYKVFRRSLSNYLRMGRRGMKFALNCQSPAETKGMVSGQEDFTILCNMTSPFDIELATEHLRKVNLIRKDQISSLYRFKPGQFLFCESGKPARTQYYFKPRTIYWKPGMGDFYKHTWQQINGNWKKTLPLMEELDRAFKEEEKEINLKRKDVNLKREEIRVMTPTYLQQPSEYPLQKLEKGDPPEGW